MQDTPESDVGITKYKIQTIFMISKICSGLPTAKQISAAVSTTLAVGTMNGSDGYM